MPFSRSLNAFSHSFSPLPTHIHPSWPRASPAQGLSPMARSAAPVTHTGTEGILQRRRCVCKRHMLLTSPAKPWHHRFRSLRSSSPTRAAGPAGAPLQHCKTLSALPPPPSSPAEISRAVSPLSHDWIPLKTAENTPADGN